MEPFVSKLYQELNCPGRDSRVGQEPHRSGANGVKFVLCQDSRIGEHLANILSFEIRKVRHNLLWRHTVRDEVDDVRDGDAEGRGLLPVRRGRWGRA